MMLGLLESQTIISLLLQDANLSVQLHRQDDAWHFQSHHSWHSEHQPSRQAISLACMLISFCMLTCPNKGLQCLCKGHMFCACHPLDVALCHEDTSYRVMSVAFETSPSLTWLSGWTSISHTSFTRYPAQVKVEPFEKCRPIVDRCTASSSQMFCHH